MKILLGVLLLVGVAWAAKPYEGWSISVESTDVNANGVRFIEATEDVTEGVPKRLTFSCNQDSASCSTPAVGGHYKVSTRGQAYKCDNYALCPANGSCIRVCLRNVY